MPNGLLPPCGRLPNRVAGVPPGPSGRRAHGGWVSLAGSSPPAAALGDAGLDDGHAVARRRLRDAAVVAGAGRLDAAVVAEAGGLAAA